MKNIFLMMSTLCGLVLVGCAGQSEGSDVDLLSKTVIYDQAEADMMPGKHLFTSSITSPEDGVPYRNFGTVTVIDDNGLYRIHGRHEHYYTPYRPVDERQKAGGYVDINGVITEVHEHYFIFKGKIETGVIERKFTEQEIQARMRDVRRSRKDLEDVRLTSTIDPDFKKYLNICTRSMSRLYKFARKRDEEKVAYPGYPAYWRLQTPHIPEHCDRQNDTYESIEIFTKNLDP